jgi:hypothetical protein
MPPATGTAYTDDDLVYVDPDTNTVVGRVEWNKNGNPKSMPFQQPATGEANERRSRFRKFYPFGTMRSMKRVYHVEGKRKKEQPTSTLDQIMEKALKEPYWD